MTDKDPLINEPKLINEVVSRLDDVPGVTVERFNEVRAGRKLVLYVGDNKKLYSRDVMEDVLGKLGVSPERQKRLEEQLKNDNNWEPSGSVRNGAEDIHYRPAIVVTDEVRPKGRTALILLIGGLALLIVAAAVVFWVFKSGTPKTVHAKTDVQLPAPATAQKPIPSTPIKGTAPEPVSTPAATLPEHQVPYLDNLARRMVQVEGRVQQLAGDVAEHNRRIQRLKEEHIYPLESRVASLSNATASAPATPKPPTHVRTKNPRAPYGYYKGGIPKPRINTHTVPIIVIHR